MHVRVNMGPSNYRLGKDRIPSSKCYAVEQHWWHYKPFASETSNLDNFSQWQTQPCQHIILPHVTCLP